ENMAGMVWKTLETYGLKGRIVGVMMDNASNNDTLMADLERRCRSEFILFSAGDSRMRCMPHTIHLAAIKLLEAIGAISKADKKKATAGNYQDDVGLQLGCEFDDDAVLRDDDEAEEDMEGVLLAMDKLRKIVRNVRVSPQRRQAWFKEVTMLIDDLNVDEKMPALMLILDVKT
ncbi:hypothetical protein C8J56DRAFT_752587, partial [Mycena floridula]